MDNSLNREIAEIFSQNSLTELEIKEDNVEIKLKREITQISSVKSEIENNTSVYTDKLIPTIQENFNIQRSHEIKSPLVGIFYAAPSPEAEPYVQIGSKVKKGDTLCIVEAMKLMNEIASDIDGEIIDICAENGQIIEFGQTIFKIV